MAIRLDASDDIVLYPAEEILAAPHSNTLIHMQTLNLQALYIAFENDISVLRSCIASSDLLSPLTVEAARRLLKANTALL